MVYENVKCAMDNLCRVPMFNTVLSIKEVDFWLENYSDTVFCNGKLRRVKFEKITEKNYKVYSEAV